MLQENQTQQEYAPRAGVTPREFATHLTAADVGGLWGQYMSATLADCVFQYFLSKVECQETRQVLSFTQQVTRGQIERIRQILENDDYPIPIGLTASDVNVNAPRLYSDPFFLAYLRNLARLGLINFSTALTVAAREDARQHFRQSVAEMIAVEDKAVKVEKEQGLYVRAPYIPAPEKPEFAQSSDYLGSIFGAKRPLNALEIGNVFVGCQNNIIGKPLLMGFAQTAESKELREFFLRGKEIAHKHIELLSALLINNDLPAPMSLDSYVTNATVSPFSDKLMLAHTMLLLRAGLMYYGAASANTARMDITVNYVRMMTEASQYLEDAAQIMIRHKWLEQPPMAVDRRELVLQ